MQQVLGSLRKKRSRENKVTPRVWENNSALADRLDRASISVCQEQSFLMDQHGNLLEPNSTQPSRFQISSSNQHSSSNILELDEAKSLNLGKSTENVQEETLENMSYEIDFDRELMQQRAQSLPQDMDHQTHSMFRRRCSLDHSNCTLAP